MPKRQAPYRHHDGSTCWTRHCSRGNFFVGSTAPEFNAQDFYGPDLAVAPDADPADIAYLRSLLGEPAPATPPEPAIAGALRTILGAELNASHAWRTLLPKRYDPARHEPVRNVAATELSWVKPSGALWLSTHDEAQGSSGWDRLVSGMFPRSVQHTVHFAPEAKVLVVDSRADYLAALAAYPHTVERTLTPQEATWFPHGATSLMQRDGTPKRGLDWERMAKDYDAFFLTERGLWECGKGDFRHEQHHGDVSLYIWDIESAVVFHPAAVVVT